MDRRRRLALGLVLSLVLLGLCVHYGATYDESWPHPTGDQLAEDQDKYVGERVLLFGDVQTIGEDTAIIHVTDGDGDVAAELEIRNVDLENGLEPGGVVQVYGVLEADQAMAHDGTMVAEETVVVDPSPNATIYKYVASAIGGLFAAGFFLRHWQVDGRRLRFEPRNGTSSRSNGSPPTGESNSNASSAELNADRNTAETNPDTTDSKLNAVEERDSEVNTRG